MPQLTPNISEAEMGVEGADQRLKDNAKFLCVEILEPIRAHYASSIIIHCGYRPPEHNAAVGGKPKSYHLFNDGKAAADFHLKGIGFAQAFDWIRAVSGLPFDKVILEHDVNDVPKCIHVQVDRFNAPRRLAFVGSTGDGKVYTPVAVGPPTETADK